MQLWRKMTRHCSITVLASVLFFVAAAGCQKQPAGLEQANPAPDFTGVDVEGRKIELSDYRGNVVLLIFWTTWCAGCQEELPYTSRIYRKYEQDGFRVIGINLNVNRAEFVAFQQMIGLDWPQIYDGGGHIASLYHVEKLPATFLLDRKGIIRYTDLVGRAELEDAVRHLLGLPQKSAERTLATSPSDHPLPSPGDVQAKRK